MVSVPGALALYYAVSNIVAVAQQSYLLKQDAFEMDKVADQSIEAPKNHKKATAKAREKVATTAKVTNVTKIKAKGSKKKARK
jgi:membrane protein insertase Oxa1/YidC/SpoIIIJ